MFYVEEGLIGTRSAVEMKTRLHDQEYISVEQLKAYITENTHGTFPFSGLVGAYELLKYLNENE